MPGVNYGVKFSVVLHNDALKGSQLMTSSFLSTLITCNADWGDEGSDNYKFKSEGKLVTINGVDIPWLSQAVQALKFNMLVNNPPECALVTNIMISHLKLALSDFKSAMETSKPPQTKLTSGLLSFTMSLPMKESNFGIEMISATHEIRFIHPETQRQYARIEVTDHKRTTINQGDDSTVKKESYHKSLIVELAGSILVVSDKNSFARYFLNPLINQKEVSVLVWGKITGQISTPLGAVALPIRYQQKVKLHGMNIMDENHIQVDHVKLLGSRSKGSSAELDLAFDMNLQADGDLSFAVRGLQSQKVETES